MDVFFLSVIGFVVTAFIVYVIASVRLDRQKRAHVRGPERAYLVQSGKPKNKN